MPYSSGTFSLVAGNPVVTGTTISSTVQNNTMTDIATGLSTCLLKDGTQTTTATIPFANAVTMAQTLVVTGLITPSAGIKGTATNDSATAGNVGEYIESVVSSVACGSNDVWTAATSITLTAGDWDVSGTMTFSPTGLTATRVLIGIGTAAGDNNTGMVLGSSRFDFPVPGTNPSGGTIPTLRVSLSGNQTLYLKSILTYSAGSAVMDGRLSARRAR